MSQRAKRRSSSLKNGAITFDQMNSPFQPFTLQFRKPLDQRWLLRGQVVDCIAGDVPPTLNQDATKLTFSIINDERLFGWSSNSIRAVHQATLYPDI